MSLKPPMSKVLSVALAVYLLSPNYQTPHPNHQGHPVFNLVAKICTSGRTQENRKVRFEERVAACNAFEEYEGYEDWAVAMRTWTIAKAKMF